MATTLAPGKVIVSAVVDERQREELVLRARAGDRSLSAELRIAIRAYLERAHNGNEEAA